MQIIHCVGIESAPADLLAWAVVKTVREKLACQTKEITGAIYDFKYASNQPFLNHILNLPDPPAQAAEPSLQS
jgi:hypothetical protein